MRSTVALTLAVLSGTAVDGFGPSSTLGRVGRMSPAALSMGYVPDGLSAEEWKKIQAKEKEAKKNLGKIGPNRFKSRSFQAWQEAGAGHLFPVDPKKVKSGEIAMKDVPYMQRGGAWDDSDLNKKKKAEKKWLETDKKYASGGYVKEQSVSIFGGAPLPWNVKFEKMDPKAIDPRARQKNWKRPGSVLPMSKETKSRLAREEAEAKKKEAKLKAQLNGEKKKGFLGLW
ncbi:unnamed protein product [Choristocarpus tenellus]